MMLIANELDYDMAISFLLFHFSSFFFNLGTVFLFWINRSLFLSFQFFYFLFIV